VLANTKKLQFFVLILPNQQFPHKFADLKLVQTINLEFPVLNVVILLYLNTFFYMLYKKFLQRIILKKN
jgi:replication initiation and membrane attachment protein DnaB